jgi:PIN domain nuclease of toxin-antitoxin system
VIVLDTHVLVWWAAGGPLSERARESIEREAVAHGLVASSISVWEIALLVEKGRLELTLDAAEWLARLDAVQELRFAPVDNAVALASARLPGSLHSDPADRMIVATARALDAPLVTRDRRLREYPYVETIW